MSQQHLVILPQLCVFVCTWIKWNSDNRSQDFILNMSIKYLSYHGCLFLSFFLLQLFYTSLWSWCVKSIKGKDMFVIANNKHSNPSWLQRAKKIFFYSLSLSLSLSINLYIYIYTVWFVYIVYLFQKLRINNSLLYINLLQV